MVKTQEDRLATFMDIYPCSQEEAQIRLDIYDAGLHKGETLGRQAAQRFMRLALGIEEPSPTEKALWDNPIPLKGE